MRSRLEAAYAHTTYWVEARPFPIPLRVGARSLPLDRLLHSRGVRHWAFVTAWNPYSQQKPHWYNALRARRLASRVSSQRWRSLPALAEGDHGDWPVEEGVLALGIAHGRARWVAAEQWHPQQRTTTDADGSYRLALPYSDSRELTMDILKHGAEVEVLAPDSLRREVADALRAAAAVYAQ